MADKSVTEGTVQTNKANSSQLRSISQAKVLEAVSLKRMPCSHGCLFAKAFGAVRRSGTRPLKARFDAP